MHLLSPFSTCRADAICASGECLAPTCSNMKYANSQAKILCLLVKYTWSKHRIPCFHPWDHGKRFVADGKQSHEIGPCLCGQGFRVGLKTGALQLPGSQVQAWSLSAKSSQTATYVRNKQIWPLNTNRDGETAYSQKKLWHVSTKLWHVVVLQTTVF